MTTTREVLAELYQETDLTGLTMGPMPIRVLEDHEVQIYKDQMRIFLHHIKETIEEADEINIARKEKKNNGRTQTN